MVGGDEVGPHALERFPRFGTHSRDPPPAVPVDPVIEVGGRRVPVADLAGLERRAITADFHCVAGWSATGLHWEGVPVATLVAPAVGVTHLRFEGLDGHWSVAAIEDLEGALIADTLNGKPLTAKHGAPARLVSPDQYGFVSTKHLCRIELLDREPFFGSGAANPISGAVLAALGFKRFTRARVWKQERHRYLPAWFVRRAVAPLVRRPPR